MTDLIIILNIFIFSLGIFILFFLLNNYLSLKEERMKKILRWIIYTYLLFILYKAFNIFSSSIESLQILTESIFLTAMICTLLVLREILGFTGKNKPLKTRKKGRKR